LSIYNASGSLVRFDADSGFGGDAFISYTPSTTGTYYIAPEALFAGTGTYTVQILEMINSDDAWAMYGLTTSLLPLGGTYAGNVDHIRDGDYVQLDMVAGQTYQIDVRGSSSGVGTLSNPYLSILLPNSFTVVGVDNDSGVGSDAQIMFTATVTGRHNVAVEAADNGTGSYVVSFAQASPPVEDYTATTATTGSVAVGGTMASTIGTAADVDWIRVTLTAGTLYQFDGRGAGSTGGTLADPTLSLLNSSGTAIRADNDSGTGADSRILYTPTTSGTYYLAMRSTSATATGTYTVAATANPDDYTATVATSGTVSAGATASGVIETAGNRDWFRTTLTVGTLYSFELRGTASGSGLRWTDSSLVLRDDNGSVVTSDTESGLGASARLTFSPTRTGTYFLDALPYSTGVGSYTLSVITGSAQQAPAIAEETDPDLTLSGLAAVTAPPSVDLGDVSHAGEPSDPGMEITPAGHRYEELTAPPPDMFFASPEDQHRLESAVRLERLLLTQPSNPFGLLALG
jgi:hypothetical protein